jgi:DNA-binding response OmpR family regulator
MNEKLKVLIIEDDPYLQNMYSTKLELEGFNIVSSFDGEEGAKKAGIEMPNIILLDIMLPTMNGFEVLEKIKKDEKTKNIPVVLLTNLDQKEDIQKGLSLGACDYLIKAHFLPSEVVEKVNKIINI